MSGYVGLRHVGSSTEELPNVAEIHHTIRCMPTVSRILFTRHAHSFFIILYIVKYFA